MAEPKAARKTKTEAERASDFVEAAERRVNSSIKSLRRVRSLASKRYHYTPAQTARILEALANEVKGIQNAFENPASASASGFRLADS